MISSKIGKVVAILALLVAAQVARADLMVYGSYWDAGDLQKGAGGGAGLGLEFLPFLELDARAGYLTMEHTDVNMIPLEAALIVKLPLKMLVPYAGVGAGYYMFDGGDVNVDDNVGAFAVAGLRIVGKSGFGIMAEGRWLMLDTKVDSLGNKLEGLNKDSNADGLGVNAGIVWQF